MVTIRKITLKWFDRAGYALDPSIDNYEVPTKYIGSVEEAEKNQGKETSNMISFMISLLSFVLYSCIHKLTIKRCMNHHSLMDEKTCSRQGLWLVWVV